MNDSLNITLPARITRAKALHRAGEVDGAIQIYRQLVAQRPDDPQILSLLGVALLQSGQTADGIGLLERSLHLRPDQPHALSNVAVGLCALRRPGDAIRQLDRAIALKPDFPGAHYQRAVALRDLGRLHEALTGFDRAIELDPEFSAAYNERGKTRLDLDQTGAALADFVQSIALDPDNADAPYNLGGACHRARRFEEAVASYTRALELNPGLAAAYNNRGRALRALARPADALSDYDRAIALDPQCAEAHNNRGVALQALRRLDDSLASYQRAVALKPDLADATWNMALLNLLRGNFETGWTLYESRRSLQTQRTFAQPQWRGETPIQGRTLLIHAEQGLGDTIQFCRYVPLLTQRQCRVVLDVPAKLTSLLSTLEAPFQLVAQGGALPPFDLHCPMLSLPLAFRTRLETIPSVTPYLFADVHKSAAIHRALGAKTVPRVGLVWSGGAAHEEDHNRSIRLAQLQDLMDLPIEFHSLHREYRDVDLALLQGSSRIHDHRHELADFSDTAALISAMDVVVSVDTAVAHLCGALAKPVWMLLSYSADFRWLLDRPDSPWYPTAILFRQRAPGDWSGAIREVLDRLAALGEPAGAGTHPCVADAPPYSPAIPAGAIG